MGKNKKRNNKAPQFTSMVSAATETAPIDATNPESPVNADGVDIADGAAGADVEPDIAAVGVSESVRPTGDGDVALGPSASHAQAEKGAEVPSTAPEAEEAGTTASQKPILAEPLGEGDEGSSEDGTEPRTGNADFIDSNNSTNALSSNDPALPSSFEFPDSTSSESAETNNAAVDNLDNSTLGRDSESGAASLQSASGLSSVETHMPRKEMDETTVPQESLEPMRALVADKQTPSTSPPTQPAPAVALLDLKSDDADDFAALLNAQPTDEEIPQESVDGPRDAAADVPRPLYSVPSNIDDPADGTDVFAALIDNDRSDQVLSETDVPYRAEEPNAPNPTVPGSSGSAVEDVRTEPAALVNPDSNGPTVPASALEGANGQESSFEEPNGRAEDDIAALIDSGQPDDSTSMTNPPADAAHVAPSSLWKDDGPDDFVAMIDSQTTETPEVPAAASDAPALSLADLISEDDNDPETADAFAGLAEQVDGTSPADDAAPIVPAPESAHIEDAEDEDDFSALLASSTPNEPVPASHAGEADGMAQAEAQKWADLMDEFEELDEPSLVTKDTEAKKSMGAGAIFDDDPSDFDQILDSAQQEIGQMAAQHRAPSTLDVSGSQPTSVVQLFGGKDDDASTWLDDTIIDDTSPLDDPSTALSAPYTATTAASATTETEDTTMEFDVPEGWVDDDGTFRYYTAEEKEAVRRSMMDAAPVQPEPEPVAKNPYSALQRSSSSFYGGSGMSENAARRTPQPQESSNAPTASAQAYDPYAPIVRPSSSAPPAAQPAFITPAATAGFVPAPPAIESYAPVQPPASSSSYDPYAPSASAYPAPYGGSSRSMPSALAPAPLPVSKPAPPQRVASNAYDPPLRIKPQKSFVRPTPPPVQMSVGRVQPTPPPGPPPAAAPPPGPPRRAPSVPPPPPVAPPSRPPSAFVPPPPVLAIQEAATPPLTERGEYDAVPASLAPPAPPPGPPRGPPSGTPSSAAQRKAPTFNSFDPPIKASPVSRPTSRTSQRPAFEAPHPVPPVPMAFAPPPSSTPADNGYGDDTQRAQPPRGPPGLPPQRSMTAPSPAARFAPPPPGPPPITFSPRAPPKVAVPPPGPPPRRDTPETPAEDAKRSSGVPITKGWPHLTGEEDEDMGPEEEDGEEARKGPMELTPRPSEVEDFDPEGGADDGNWGADEIENYPPKPVHNDVRAPSPVHERGQRASFGGQAELSPQSSLGLHDESSGNSAQANSGLYSSPASATPAPPRPISRGPPPGPPPIFNRQNSTSVHGAGNDPYSRDASAAPSEPPASRAPPPGPLSAPNRQASSTGYEPYAAATQPEVPAYGVSPVKSRPPIPSPSMGAGQVPSDPYVPSVGTANEVSEAYTSAIPHPPAQSSYDSPYGPPPVQTQGSYAPASVPVGVPSDPYGRTASPVQTSDYSSSGPNTGSYFQAVQADTSYVPQQVLEQRPVSEDPLGRGSAHAKNVPLAVFGFGGVLITAFPAQASAQEDLHTGKGHSRAPSYGYASVRGKVWIRGVADMASSSAIKSDSDNAFPGPLLYDAATKGAAAEKKKKEALMLYLETRADEVERGLPYLKSASATTGVRKRREEEGKVVLLRVLAAMLLDEGKDGRAKYQEGLIKALSNAQSQPLLSPTATSFASQNGMYGASASRPAKSAPASTSSQISTLTDLLSTGNKREAVEYASRQSLWPHALIIASSVGPDLWRDTVKQFAEAELTGEGMGGMKAAYLLFAGAGASAADHTQVDELFTAANITDDPAKDQWKEVIGSVVLNGQPADAAQLDELGVRLAKKGLNNAASVCYLLSSASPFADPSPNAVNKPMSILQDARDEDAIIFAEVAEYARSLLPVPKGQEVPFAGLPKLLPYKLQRAWLAAEVGEVDLAQRYCQAVETASKAIKNGPALLSPHHTASLEDLLERLTGSPSIEPAKNLSARKATAKPGLDKLGSWLEGRLTKFIAGDDDSSAAPAAIPILDPKDKSAPVGPFSHFASISPGQSADVSRNTSVPDFGASGSISSINGLLSAGPPAMGGRTSPFGRGDNGYENAPASPSKSTSAMQGYSPFNPSEVASNEDTGPGDGADDEAVELLNPMAALSFGAPSGSSASYAPMASASTARAEVDLGDEDEDDLGFGNAGLSRDRTPRPPAGKADEDSSVNKEEEVKEQPKVDKGKDKDASPAPDAAAPKKGWLSGWFAKKEEGTGPVKAKLGEENAMVFDPDLKRWVVKGQKPDAAPAAPPPPPRSSTATPAGPSSSSGPPAGTPSNFSNTMPRMGSTSNLPAGGSPAGAPSRAPSAAPPGAPPPVPPGSRPASTAPPSGGMTPMAGPPKPKGATPSIDDLLSRPSSKRPGSAAARKGAKNRYVDVFQQPQ